MKMLSQLSHPNFVFYFVQGEDKVEIECAVKVNHVPKIERNIKRK